MVPNDFGLIRQKNHNLFACLFPNLKDISEYEFEVIYPEYIEGYTTNGSTTTADVRFCYAVEDVSKYDMILYPAYGIGTTAIQSGMNSTGLGASLTVYSSIRGYTNGMYTYNLTQVVVGVRDHLIINSGTGEYLPYIGFKRHRTDGVNPKG